MPNPFYTGQNVPQMASMTPQNAINLMMQQAFQMGTDNFVKKLCKNNPQAQQIYNALMQSGNPTQFYLDMMKQRGMSQEQAIDLANRNGIKL